MKNTEQFHAYIKDIKEKEFTTDILDMLPKKNQHWFLKISITTLLSLLLILCVGVNVSPIFAKAIKKIPVLNDIGDALQFTHAEEASRHGYVQNEETITYKIGKGEVNVKGILADDNKIWLVVNFDKLKSDAKKMGQHVELEASSGDLKGTGFTKIEDKDSIYVFNYQGDTPKNIDLNLVYYDNESGNTVSYETITIPIDKSKIGSTKKYEINEDIKIDGLDFTIKEIKITPLETSAIIVSNMDIDTMMKDLDIILSIGDTRDVRMKMDTSNGNELTYTGNSKYFEHIGKNMNVKVRNKNRKSNYSLGLIENTENIISIPDGVTLSEKIENVDNKKTKIYCGDIEESKKKKIAFTNYFMSEKEIEDFKRGENMDGADDAHIRFMITEVGGDYFILPLYHIFQIELK